MLTTITPGIATDYAFQAEFAEAAAEDALRDWYADAANWPRWDHEEGKWDL